MTTRNLKKVAVISASISRAAGGLFFSVRHLTEEIKEIGDFECTVLGILDEHTMEDLSKWGGLDVKIFKKSIPGKYSFSIGLILHLLREPYDLIHLHGIWNFTSLAVMLISIFKKVPYIVSPRGMLDPWILNKSKFKKKISWSLIERYLIKNAKYIHALNRSEKDAVDALGVARDIIILPNGVKHIVSTKTYWDQNRKLLLYIGRIDPKKGLLEFITHWSFIENYNGWEVEIYGWGDQQYLDLLFQCIKIYNIKNIKIGGEAYGEYKETLLKGATAFFLPSYSEGMPMAVLEAWAFGLPTLLTEFCNLPEAFEYGSAKKLELDDEKYVESLKNFLLIDEASLKIMSNNSINLVNSGFHWNLIAKKMNSTYIRSISYND